MLHPVSVQSCYRWFLAGRPTLACPCEEVHQSKLLMRSPLLLHQCLTCLAHLVWMVFRDGWWVSIQLLLCGMLPPGLVQYSLQHSCATAIKLSLHILSQRPCGASIQQYWHDGCLEKNALYLIGLTSIWLKVYQWLSMPSLVVDVIFSRWYAASEVGEPVHKFKKSFI